MHPPRVAVGLLLYTTVSEAKIWETAPGQILLRK